MSLEGTTLDVGDTTANRRAFPQLRVVGLLETGTHVRRSCPCCRCEGSLHRAKSDAQRLRSGSPPSWRAHDNACGVRESTETESKESGEHAAARLRLEPVLHTDENEQQDRWQCTDEEIDREHGRSLQEGTRSLSYKCLVLHSAERRIEQGIERRHQLLHRERIKSLAVARLVGRIEGNEVGRQEAGRERDGGPETDRHIAASKS